MVAALLALGTLSILSGQAAALKPNVFDIEPKVYWGLCMYTAHASGYGVDSFTGFMCFAAATGLGEWTSDKLKNFLDRIEQREGMPGKLAKLSRYILKLRFFTGPKGALVLTA